MNAHRVVHAADDAQAVRATLAPANPVLVEDVRADADVQAEGRAVLATIVDAPAFDLAALAWEVATCWVPEPTYARRCLHQLQQRTGLTAP